MPKRLLTLDDLCRFCESTNFSSFNSDEYGYQLCVSVPSVFEKEESDDGLTLFGKVKLFHTNTNRNGSNVTKDAAEKCLDGIKYKPVLANFCEFTDEYGNTIKDFTSHDMIQNDDGTITYLERQVGCFTADKPILEYDEEHDRYYVITRCAIPREYTDAAEIIERKGGTKISAELLINKMSYDAQKKELILEDIDVAGGTCLGKNPETGDDVGEGMEGSRIDIENFGVKNFAQKFETDPVIIKLLEDINNKLDAFSDKTKKIGKEDTMNKFEQLLALHGKTIDDITFEYEGMSDEELEIAFSTAFAVAEPEHTEGDVVEKTIEFSVTRDGNTKTFSISLNDKLEALHALVNETYGESDNDYYDVVVYEDEERLDMCGWFTGKSYRQSFKCKKKKEYSLVGDRVETFKKYLTQDEINELESMKVKYAELEQYKATKEFEIAHAEKMAVLDKYSSIANEDEFKSLANNIDAFSKEEIAEKAEAIVGRCALRGVQFSAENKTTKRKLVGLSTVESKNPKSYSGLFD